MTAMADAYEVLLDDRILLLLQMQAYAACEDLEIRDATRTGFRRLWEQVERITGLPYQTVVDFFAVGMLDERRGGDEPARGRRTMDLVVPEALAVAATLTRRKAGLGMPAEGSVSTAHKLGRMQEMTSKSRMIWAFAVTSTALFMASLDNLVVTTALPSIREHLHAGLEGLQWTVNGRTR